MMPCSERVQSIALSLKKTYKFFKEQIRKTFCKKCRKLFLKTLDSKCEYSICYTGSSHNMYGGGQEKILK